MYARLTTALHDDVDVCVFVFVVFGVSGVYFPSLRVWGSCSGSFVIRVDTLVESILLSVARLACVAECCLILVCQSLFVVFQCLLPFT